MVETLLQHGVTDTKELAGWRDQWNDVPLNPAQKRLLRDALFTPGNLDSDSSHTEQGNLEYWDAKTMVEIRQSPAYCSLPIVLNKSKLGKDKLCQLLAEWCKNQGNIYVIGSVPFWECFTKEQLLETATYERLPRSLRKSKLSKPELCAALAEHHLKPPSRVPAWLQSATFRSEKQEPLLPKGQEYLRAQ